MATPTAPADPAVAQAVVAAYGQQTAALREQIAVVIAALWQQLGEYRQADMAAFVQQVVPVVQGAMGQMQALTAGYLSTYASLHGGTLTPTPTTTLTVPAVRNGATAADVYGRPFHLVWRQLHDQAPLDGARIAAAIKAGEDRAVQTALTDVQLAKTHTAQQVLSSDSRIVGYRRVLEGPHSCALCVVASTLRYHKVALLPIHPACDCAVLPIYGDHDPGTSIDDDTLAAAHAAVAAQFGQSSAAAQDIRGALQDDGSPVLYRDVLIQHTHGELGPVLAVRGQTFTGPSDLN